MKLVVWFAGYHFSSAIFSGFPAAQLCVGGCSDGFAAAVAASCASPGSTLAAATSNTKEIPITIRFMIYLPRVRPEKRKNFPTARYEDKNCGVPSGSRGLKAASPPFAMRYSPEKSVL